jgi:hypothetical protein
MNMEYVELSPLERSVIRDNLHHRSVLFKTVFGSNLYGTNTPTSDKDYKAVFLPPLVQLLEGRGIKNVVQNTNKSGNKNDVDDIDFEWIPFQVFARDFMAGQTYALELAFAAVNPAGIECSAHPIFTKLCEDMISKFLTSNIRAMMGYALGQAHKYGIKGTRLATVKKFEGVVKKYETSKLKLAEIPEFLEEVKLISDKYLFFTEYEPFPGTKAPAISLLEKMYPLDIPMAEAVLRTQRQQDSYGKRAETAMAASGVDWKAVSHAVRITYQALDILKNHRIVLPFGSETATYLREIKQGLRSWEEVESHLADLMAEVDLWKSQTTLRDKTPELDIAFEQWLMETSVFLYNLDTHLLDNFVKYEGVEV